MSGADNTQKFHIRQQKMRRLAIRPPNAAARPFPPLHLRHPILPLPGLLWKGNGDTIWHKCWRRTAFFLAFFSLGGFSAQHFRSSPRPASVGKAERQ